jgi:hypothetical protein
LNTGLNTACIGRELLVAVERVTLSAIWIETSDLKTMSYNSNIEGLTPASIGRQPLAEGESDSPPGAT